MVVKNTSHTPLGLDLRCILKGHSDIITGMAWSPDGLTLATAAYDNSIRLWNVQTGEQLLTLEGHEDVVCAVSWSSDGQTIASGSKDKTIRLWNTLTGEMSLEIEAFSGLVYDVAWSPDGQILASGARDRNVKLWDAKDKKVRRILKGHSDYVRCVAWSPDGNRLASSSDDKTIRLWDPWTGELIRVLKGHFGFIFSVDWSPDGSLLASGSTDSTISLWDAQTGQRTIILEGHTTVVTSVSFSKDGQLLASKSWDGTVRLWRCDTWETVTTVTEPSSSADLARLAFNVKLPILSTLGEEDRVIRLWNVDHQVLLNSAPAGESVQYTTAKVTLMGDSGVGKTGLGWRLSHGEFKEHPSTHGQQFWVLDTLHKTLEDGTECEVVLWDFAGQPDYRLMHALFLDDADLALILFDPSNRLEPLKGVEYWLRVLFSSEHRPCRTILVGARNDRGETTLTRDEIEAFCRQNKIRGGYITTSALTGDGLEELWNRLTAEINWAEMTTTVTTAVFKRIKDYILRLKENKGFGKILVSYVELTELLTKQQPENVFTELDVAAATKNLAKHGYVTLLRRSSGEEVVLIAPDVLNNLAASFILEARRNPKGLGALDEFRILHAKYNFPELVNLETDEQEILLDSVTHLFLERNICFRESVGSETFLVFPALINQKKPHLDDVEIAYDISYSVSGAVENIYASMVVMLGYTNTFTRTNQWQDHAQYEMSPGEVCGFRQILEQEGEVEFVLYYGTKVPQQTRLLFQGLFEKFLGRREVKVAKYPPVICSTCNYRQERTEVVRRIRGGNTFLFCGECGQKTLLPRVVEDVLLSPQDFEKLNRQEDMVQRKTIFEVQVTSLKGFMRDIGDTERPTCFISYAWGEPEHERWVNTLAKDLQNAWIKVIFDKQHNAAIGSNLSRFISRIHDSNFIVVIGTPLYKKKYGNAARSAGSVVAAEMDLINQRLIGNEQEKATVLPLLLAGSEKESLPPLTQGKVYCDFRQPELYFQSLFDLILTLYRISFDIPAIGDLREALRDKE
jgi:small GTP-binding protein